LPEAGDSFSLGMTAPDAGRPRYRARGKAAAVGALQPGRRSSLYVVDDAGDVALKPVAVKSYESNSVVSPAASMKAPG